MHPATIQPPVHLTGDVTADWVVFLAAYGAVLYFLLYWLRALRLARDTVRPILFNVAVAIGIWFLGSAWVQSIPNADPSLKLLPYIVALVFFVARSSIRRSRYIPADVRRRVIARDLKGRPFDSRIHHIDHIWPFYLGGSNTSDNLRVVERGHNLKKGRKRPRLKQMM